MRAVYDLGKYISSFNFLEWLVQAEANGATMVVFDIRNIRSDKWPLQIARERFYSICQPAPALIGLPQQTVLSGEAIGRHDLARPGGGPLVAFWKAGRRFKRLKSVLEPGKAKYTVTLRKTQRAEGRNSDEVMWLEFATEIGALVIPDYDTKPIHLHERMALYAGAEMNFFVSNGPGILCSMSEYPCMMFNTKHARESLLGDGLRDGEVYPWMLPNQMAIWELATAESLRRHFYHWRETGKFAKDLYEPR